MNNIELYNKTGSEDIIGKLVIQRVYYNNKKKNIQRD